jgi:hypothetical protein
VTRLLALVALIMLVCLPHVAAAHGRDTSHSRWRLVGDRIEVALRVSGSDLARAGGAAALLDTLHVEGPQAACVREATIALQPLDAGDTVLRSAFDCSGVAGPRVARVDMFERLGPAHVHMLALEDRPEQLLGASARHAALDPAHEGEPATGLLDFVRLGLAHVLEGLDHLAFLLALLLGVPSLARAAWLVTGFTLGHALSLALLALGLVQPHAGAVELLIAASVLIVAAREHDDASGRMPELVAAALALAALLASVRLHASALACWGASMFAWGYLHRARTRRGGAPLEPALIAAFGLVHGAGFAGVLQQTTLPHEAELVALLGFNLGVELAALALVLLGWPVLAYLRARGLDPRRPACLLLGALASAWIVQRVLG